MLKLFYLRGALGNKELLEEHKEPVENLLSGNYTEGNLEKLKGHNLYSFRLNKKGRLLFTLVKVNGEEYLLLLDHIPNHEYHKSRFLRPGVLKKYLERQADEYESVIDNPLEFEPVNEESKERIQKAIYKEKGVGNSIAVMEYFHEKPLELNVDQQETLAVALPAVITGVTGSGKSGTAICLFNSYCLTHNNEENDEGEKEEKEKETEEDLPLLYISKSPYLVHKMKEAWQALPLEEKAKQRVEFKTFDELVSEFPEAQGKTLANCETFNHWYTDYHARQKKAARTKKQRFELSNDNDLIYQEFRIRSGYSPEEYAKLGQQQSLIEQKNRHFLEKAYQSYLSHLQSKKLFSPDFSFVTSNKQYKLVVVDESQDFSFLQLNFLSQIAKNRSIVYCIDSHQRLFDALSARPYLLQKFKIPENSHIQLKVSYRCFEKIVDVANEVIAFKHLMVGGITDRYEATKIQTVEENKGKGALYVLDKKQLEASLPWIHERAKTPDLVVITQEQYIQDAKQLFKAKLVLTPEQAKGLEYDTVIAYRLYSEDLFKKIYQRQQEIDALGKVKQPTHQAKSNEAHEDLGPGLNRIYTSYTRACNTLVIYEEDDKKDNKEKKGNKENNVLLNRLRPHASPGIPSEEAKVKATDWKEEARKQMYLGNSAVALDILQTQFKGDDAELEVLRKEARCNPELPIESQAGKEKTDSTQLTSPVQEKAGTKKTNHRNTGSRRSSRQAHQQPKQAPKRQNKKASPKELNSLPHFFQKEPTAIYLLKSEIDFKQEQTQALALYKDFSEKRLELCLHNLDIHHLLFTSYIDQNKNSFTLIENIKNDSNKLNFLLKCIVNNLKLLLKVSQSVHILKTINPRLYNSLPEDLVLLASHYRFSTTEFINGIIERGQTIAHLSADDEELEILNLIQKLGIDLEKVDNRGLPPIGIAAAYNEVKAIQALAKFGVDLNKDDFIGATPAYIAACEEHLEALQELKKLGANLDKAMPNGATPAFIAAQNGHLKIIQFLIANKQDFTSPLVRTKEELMKFTLNQKEKILNRVTIYINERIASGDPEDKIKIFPIDIARIMGHNETVALIEKHLSQTNSSQRDSDKPIYAEAEDTFFAKSASPRVQNLKKVNIEGNIGEEAIGEIRY